MTGCNNFCSYCIVPYVRGREHSRDIEDVICECEHLVADGVRQITLLGQNVNSYGRDTYGEPRFAELLRRVGETGVDRIRFTSSHPKDLNVETISAMAETPAVMPQLHLAVQSGSDRVLRDMNRHYTASRYLDLTRRIRAAVPGIALGTDIIVGFPTETEEDFQDTMDLVREVSFDSAFTFIYSRRSGTPAATMPDVSSREQISKRFDRLKNLVEDLSFESNQRDLGTTAEVLVEGRSKRDKDVMVGHSRKNQTLHFPVPNGVEADALVGHLLDVKVREARSWYLRGVVDGDPR
jgi:tRNA-2-methylthio-N6-dimethylallyladenosine synthase